MFTVKQKTNLFHILFIFPLIFVSLYPDTIGRENSMYVHYTLLFMITVGSLYHIYRFGSHLDPMN